MKLCLKAGVKTSRITESLSSIRHKKMRELTLEDAVQLFKEGFFCACEDGKVARITNDPELI